MSFRSFWTWLTTQERHDQPDAVNEYVGNLRRRLCELNRKLGYFDRVADAVPPEHAHLRLVHLLEEFEQRLEDLERKAGGRESLRALRAWPHERGDA